MFSHLNSTYYFKKNIFVNNNFETAQITTHILHYIKIKLIINNELLLLENDLSLIPK